VQPTSASLLDDRGVARAAAHARATDAETLADQIALTEIAAPPFAEHERAAEMLERFLSAGLAEAYLDEVGNAVATRKGSEDVPPVILSAHLDTVFPEGTHVGVERSGDFLKGPGISDDGRGLAVMLAVARALAEGEVVTRRPILFAATVGEEGPGDLRGARHLVSSVGAGHGAAAFISVDGAGLDRVVCRGLGARRFRIELSGPGGHSWQDRGTVNPIHALAEVVGRVTASPPDGHVDSSIAATRWGGGLSINSIPRLAWVEMDCRATTEQELQRVEDRLHGVVQHVVANVSARGELQTDVRRVGTRPAGFTDPEGPLMQATRVATEAVGAEVVLATSSTDANAAMAAGIPAVTFGGGGQAALAHTPDEWYRNVRGVDGVLRALYTVVLAAEQSDG